MKVTKINEWIIPTIFGPMDQMTLIFLYSKKGRKTHNYERESSISGSDDITNSNTDRYVLEPVHAPILLLVSRDFSCSIAGAS